MPNIIKELYYGNINTEDFRYSYSKDSKKTFKTFCDLEDALVSVLKGEAKEIFAAYMETANKISAENMADSFTQGFRMGACFMRDIFMFEE